MQKHLITGFNKAQIMPGVDNYSDSFLPQPGIYFLSHSVGLQPKSTQSCIENAFLNVWEEDGEPWDNWLKIIESFKQNLASLFNADKREFCPQVNLSGALTKIITSLPGREDRNKIVYTENDFPSMGFVLLQMQQLGYELVCIAKDEDVLALDVWEQYLTDDVACALLTHVQSNTGIQISVPAITEITSGKGIFSVVDIAQSAGVIPIDLQKWSADFVIGSCVKWLCGGPGAGYLWVSNALIEQCYPNDVGWFSHANPFEFDIHHFEYASDASRFWGGTPSILPYAVAANSIELLQGIGIENIYQHNRNLTDTLIGQLDEQVIINPIEPEKRGGTLILHFDSRQKKIIETLQAKDIRFDARSNGLRISPHIYNSVEDINTFMEKEQPRCF